MNDSVLKVYENNAWAAYVADDQLYLGRLVIPLKNPCRRLSHMMHDEYLSFQDMVVTLENALTQAFGATMFNWSCLMNNTYQEPDPKPQVHWHFRPRYRTTPKFLGRAYPDPNFGHHYLHEDNNRLFVPQETRLYLADVIRLNVQSVQSH